MKNKKLGSILFVLLVFLITIAGSVVIILFLTPNDDTEKLVDYSNIKSSVMFSAGECGNSLGKSERYINTMLGEPTYKMDKATNKKPGDKTNVYESSSANFTKKSDKYICSWLQVWDDKIPAPRGIKIGMSYDEIMKKYPVQKELDAEFKPYESGADSFQYRTIYGEYEVTSSYAIAVWNINANESSAPVKLCYCDREAEIDFHFRNGLLKCVEYVSK